MQKGGHDGARGNARVQDYSCSDKWSKAEEEAAKNKTYKTRDSPVVTHPSRY
jgi:hypothetical protein